MSEEVGTSTSINKDGNKDKEDKKTNFEGAGEEADKAKMNIQRLSGRVTDRKQTVWTNKVEKGNQTTSRKGWVDTWYGLV